ncbi:MAG TPA: hypothetical protein PLX83_16935 [bacterium]|nr:hypothetical protein [bacterium]
MAIEYRPSESIAALGEAAYAAGLGQYRQVQQERADRYRQLQEQLALQRQQMANQYTLGLKQLELQRTNQQDYLKTLRELDTQREAARLEAQQKEWELQEKSADREIQRRLGAYQAQMTLADRREMAKLQNAKRWIKSNPALTDTQKADLLNKVNARIFGILPEDMPTQGKSVQDEVKDRVWKDSDGSIYIMQRDGTLDYRPPNKVREEALPIEEDFKQNVYHDQQGNVWTRSRSGDWKLAKEKSDEIEPISLSPKDLATMYKDFAATFPPTTPPDTIRKKFQEEFIPLLRNTVMQFRQQAKEVETPPPMLPPSVSGLSPTPTPTPAPTPAQWGYAGFGASTTGTQPQGPDIVDWLKDVIIQPQPTQPPGPWTYAGFGVTNVQQPGPKPDILDWVNQWIKNLVQGGRTLYDIYNWLRAQNIKLPTFQEWWRDLKSGGQTAYTLFSMLMERNKTTADMVPTPGPIQRPQMIPVPTSTPIPPTSTHTTMATSIPPAPTSTTVATPIPTSTYIPMPTETYTPTPITTPTATPTSTVTPEPTPEPMPTPIATPLSQSPMAQEMVSRGFTGRQVQRYMNMTQQEKDKIEREIKVLVGKLEHAIATRNYAEEMRYRSELREYIEKNLGW